MVNIAKRMRDFQPLLKLRHGKGAAILPPPPRPQLTNLTLHWPDGYIKPQIVRGPHYFRRSIVKRLKYYNPSLPINFVREPAAPNAPIILTLEFEGTDPEELRRIAQKSPNPWKLNSNKSNTSNDPQTKDLSEAEKEAAARLQSPNWRENQPKTLSSDASQQQSQSSSKRTAEDDEVVMKPQPPTDPSTPSTTSPPAPIYTRSVSLPLNGRNSGQIWSWFQKRTGAKTVPQEESDAKLWERLSETAEKSEADRQRVKAAMDAMKREKEDLKRAREAADRLSAEAS